MDEKQLKTGSTVMAGSYPAGPTGHKLTWHPDLPDYRDRTFSPSSLPGVMKAPPPLVDLRKYASAVEDQGTLGSCTANAFAGMIEIIDKRKKHVDVSRLFTYYFEREMIGTTMEDSGAYIRDGIKSLALHGWATEKEWPYNIEKFTKAPTPAVVKAAAKRKIKEYMRINGGSLQDMRTCLSYGFPFTFGFSVYDNFYEIGKNGLMGMPRGRMWGGHAVLAVGYDDKNMRMTIRNSWGEDWGDGGYFYMPYSYIINQNLCDDFWMIKLI